MSEVLHRIVVGVFFLVAAACVVLTYVGIEAYIESGRSVYGDAKKATGYQWKRTSCDELFSVMLPSPAPYSLSSRSAQLCEIAKSNRIPPIGLKSVIDESRAGGSNGSGSTDMAADSAMGLLVKIGANLARRLPELEERYKPHQREVAYMWLFFPGIAGGIGCFFYARRYTPTLFAVAKGRFEHIMFGKNRYSDAFDGFVKKARNERGHGK